jgi:hypothetical protein
MTGPSIGWKLQKNRKVISDFIGWMAGLRRIWTSSFDESAHWQSSKNRQFYSRFKSVFKLILHKPSAVVDCSGYRLVFLLSRTDKYKKKHHSPISLIGNISIFVERLVFPDVSNVTIENG